MEYGGNSGGWCPTGRYGYWTEGVNIIVYGGEGGDPPAWGSPNYAAAVAQMVLENIIDMTQAIAMMALLVAVDYLIDKAISLAPPPLDYILGKLKTMLGL